MENQEGYGFSAPATITGGALAPVEQSRAVQEVQGAIIVAKRFPRDQDAAFARIMKACKRPKLAEDAEYAYPRGNQTVTGPSIRLAEVLAQNWQNLDYGIREISQESGESEVQAYAWDMETNVRQTKTFRVPHKRKAGGSFKTLTDPRDIYEHVANMGARRLRACILGVIPGDVVDAAISECHKTLAKKGGDEPIGDRVRKMIVAFGDYGVTKEMIEERIGHRTDAIVEAELVNLRKIYNSLKDGMSKREDWFTVSTAQTSEQAENLETRLKQGPSPVEQKPQNPTTTPPTEFTADLKPSTPSASAGSEPETPGVDHPLDRDNWINLKSKGFPAFVKNFAGQIKGSAVEAEMKKKWEGMDIGPWPLDEPKAPHEPSEPPLEETDPEPPNEAEKKNGDSARRDVALQSLRQIKSIDESAWDRGRVEAVVPQGTMPESLPLNTLEAWEEAARRIVGEDEGGF